MADAKFYIDLAPHHVDQRRDGTSKGQDWVNTSMNALRPFPKAELIFIEGSPYDRFMATRIYELNNRDLFRKNVGDKDVLAKIFYATPEMVEVAVDTEAKEILYENELYSREEYESIRKISIDIERLSKEVMSWTMKGMLDDSYSCYKQLYRATSDGVGHRDGIISKNLPVYCEKEKIGSIYMKFGDVHVGLTSIPGASTRKFVDSFYFDSTSKVKEEEKILKNYMMDIVAWSVTLFQGPDQARLIKSFDFVRNFSHEDLLECKENLRKDILKRHNPVLTESIKKVFLKKIKEKYKTEYSGSSHWNLDLPEIVPKEWGGRL